MQTKRLFIPGVIALVAFAVAATAACGTDTQPAAQDTQQAEMSGKSLASMLLGCPLATR